MKPSEITCRYCGAAPGQECVAERVIPRDGAYHSVRLTDAADHPQCPSCARLRADLEAAHKSADHWRATAARTAEDNVSLRADLARLRDVEKAARGWYVSRLAVQEDQDRASLRLCYALDAMDAADRAAANQPDKEPK